MIELDSTSKAKNRPAEQEAQHKNRNLLLRAIVMISHLLRRVILSHRPFKPIWDSAQERRHLWLDGFEVSSLSPAAKLRASSIVDDSIKKEASFEFWLQVIQRAQAILWFLLFGLGEIMMFLFGLSLGIGGGPEGSLSKMLPYILAFVVYNGSIVLSQWTLVWNRRRVGLFVYLLILAVGLAAYLYLFQELLVTLELQDGPRSSYEWFQYIFLVSLSWGWIVSAWWGLLTLLASIATWLLRTVMRRGGEGIISSMVHVIVRYEILLGNKGEWNWRRLVVSDLQELAREIELSLPRIVGSIDQPSREWVLAKASAMANEVRGWGRDLLLAGASNPDVRICVEKMLVRAADDNWCLVDAPVQEGLPSRAAIRLRTFLELAIPAGLLTLILFVQWGRVPLSEDLAQFLYPLAPVIATYLAYRVLNSISPATGEQFSGAFDVWKKVTEMNKPS